MINKAAADDNDPREPWVFFIGAGERTEARWNEVATREDIEPLLRELPAART